MLMSITEVKNAYPYVDNKAIDMVIKINDPIVHYIYVVANGKPRQQKKYLKTDIETLFWTIVED